MMVGIDTATKLLVESHEYGPQNAFKRVPKTLAPAFGSQARALSKRYWTPKQIEDYQKYRKGGIRSKILDAFLEGDQKQGDRLIKAWNRANPDNLFDYNDINWKEMYKRAVRKAKKRMNP